MITYYVLPTKTESSLYVPIYLQYIFCVHSTFRSKLCMPSKVCPIENNTNLNSIFCVIKSSKFDLIFLPAFYLIMWLMTSPKNFEEIPILKKWQLVFFWGFKTYLGEIPLKWCIFCDDENKFSPKLSP